MASPLHDRVTALRSRIDDAWRVLDLDAVKQTIITLEKAMAAPDFWSDQARARRETQQLAELKQHHHDWSALRAAVTELQELIALAEKEKDVAMQQDVLKQLGEYERRYQDLEVVMLFTGPHDASNAVISIHAGAGGTDAQDWAEILQRMLLRYAEKKGWRTRILDESRGAEAGIKSVTFTVEGRLAYGHLKSEAGVHRLVRLSPFNADQLRQTSFAQVEVLPEFDETVEVEIKPDDLRIDTFMSSGKGGQGVNTTYSAVRIVHLPSKITVSCQNERSQQQNKATALKILKAKLLQLKEQEREQERLAMRGEFQSAAWGNQIRSYVLHPYQLVKDHRTDLETSDTQAVLDGDLERFVLSYLRKKAGRQVGR